MKRVRMALGLAWVFTAACGQQIEEEHRTNGNSQGPDFGAPPDGDSLRLVDTETGGSLAPLPSLCSANLVQKTVCASGCNYKSIQACHDAASAGWTCNVQNGTYSGVLKLTKSGSSSKPLCFRNAAGHAPKIDSLLTGDAPFTPKSVGNKISNYIAGRWIVFQGFEISRYWSGMVFGYTAHNVTFANNYVHGNHGVAVSPQTQGEVNGIPGKESSDNLLLQDNILAGNGSATCLDSIANGSNPCHLFYAASGNCVVRKGIVIRRNIFRDGNASGVQLRSECGTKTTTTVTIIENNIFFNVARTLSQVTPGIDSTIFRNNTIVINDVPADSPALALAPFEIYSPTALQIYNNIIDINAASVRGISVYALRLNASNSNSRTILKNNFWSTATNKWVFNGTQRTDFISKYQSVSGQDTNGIVGTVSPQFASATDFHILTGSPAKNTGLNSVCALKDKDGLSRPLSSVNPCDIGAYEFKP